MSHLSLMHMHAVLWAGGPAKRHIQGLFWMLLSKPCMSECSMGTPASSITQTAGASMSPSHTPNACWMPELSRLSGVSAIPMTMLWRKPSTACTRPRSFTGKDHGNHARRSNGQRFNGSTGSTQKGSLSPSEIFHHRRLREITITRSTKSPAQRNLNKTASDKSGAVQSTVNQAGSQRRFFFFLQIQQCHLKCVFSSAD